MLAQEFASGTVYAVQVTPSGEVITWCVPFVATATTGKFDVKINVNGGGPAGQAGAVRHGIARALLSSDVAFKPALRAEMLLTRDPRMKERKKYGQPGARKRFQFSKR